MITNDYFELHRFSGIRRPFAVDRDRLGPISYPVAAPSILGLRHLPADTDPHGAGTKT